MQHLWIWWAQFIHCFTEVPVINLRVALFHRRRFKSESDRIFYGEFKSIFGFYPKNLDLYKLAFIHKSASAVLLSGQSVNNERLEYLGDAIIDAIIADFLFVHYPEQREGFLTKMRAKIVSRSHLNRLSVQIGIQRLVVSQTSSSAHRHIFGDALEALIGAMYLDQGYSRTQKFLTENILKRFVDLKALESLETDFKSRIIEWGQKQRRSVTFAYHEEHEPHEASPIFYATLYIEGVQVSEGRGYSKKEAEQNAAMVVLSNEEELATLAQNVAEESDMPSVDTLAR